MKRNLWLKRSLKVLALFLLLAAVLCYFFAPLYHVDLPEKFEFNPANADLHSSIVQYKGEYKVEVVPG